MAEQKGRGSRGPRELRRAAAPARTAHFWIPCDVKTQTAPGLSPASDTSVTDSQTQSLTQGSELEVHRGAQESDVCAEYWGVRTVAGALPQQRHREALSSLPVWPPPAGTPRSSAP